MTKTLILGAAIALALSGAAAAQDRPAGRLDANADRQVSLAEMQAAAAERFARSDINRDGQLTAEERRAARQTVRAERQGGRAERMAAVFSRRDADRNGVLSQAETPRRLQANFAALDADQDGGLSLAELQARRQVMTRQDRPKLSPEARAARAARRTGGDGVVTRAEMQARVSERFARLDADRNGFVTREERRAARAARRG
jgi:Ca2+-binding EF-hand superfamily protein